MRKISMKHFGNALSSLLLTLFFTLLPTIISFILALARSKTQVFFNSFYTAGEFLLYTVALLSSAFVVLNLYKKKTTWCIILLIIFSVCYSAISIINSYAEPINGIFLKWTAIIGISFGIIVNLYSQYVQHQKTPDVGEYRQEEQITIKNALH